MVVTFSQIDNTMKKQIIYIKYDVVTKLFIGSLCFGNTDSANHH